MTLPILEVLVIVVGASVLLISGRLRSDLVALLVLLALGLTGLVSPADMFSGFSRSAVITVMGLFIITAGLERTGATRLLGQHLGRLAGRAEARAVLVVMISAALLSLVMNTVVAAAVLLPAVIGLSRQAGLRPSRLLLPLAYGALLGGMATIFTTANILVSAVLVDQGLQPYGVLDFVTVGGPMAVAGILYVTLWGRRWLPSRGLGGSVGPERPGGTLTEAYGLRSAVAACYVKPGSAMAGRSLSEGKWGERLGVNVVGISRGGSVDLAPQPRDQVLEGDIILFTGITDDQDLSRYGLILTEDRAWTGHLASDRVSLVEVALAPRSSFAGKTLRELRFREKYDVSVLAIWREGQTLRDALGEIPLRFGDALLLQGRPSKLQLLRDEPALIVLVEDAGPLRLPRRAALAVALTLAAVVLAAANVLPIAEAAFSAAVLMILFRCLDMSEAYAAVDWRAVFVMAGLLPLALAMAGTGAAAYLGRSLLAGLGGLGALAVAAGLYFVATLLTQLIGGRVTPLVLAPVAIAAAQQLGSDPRALALAVALGSSTAFLTPAAHSANQLVMGPGGYKFNDYARVGLPLSLIVAAVMLVGLRVFWGVR